MNDVENRLRDALAARAAVTPDPRAYDAIVARRSRRRVLLWGGIGAAAIGATAGVAVVAVVATGTPTAVVAPPASAPPTPGETTTPTIVAAPAATRAIAIVGEGIKLVRTGGPEGGLAGTSMPGRLPSGVAAAGDGERFFVTFAAQTECSTTLSSPRTSYDSMEGQPVRMLTGRGGAIAVTADATRLAYVTRTGPNCDRTELRVHDLASRAELVWPTTAPGDAITSLAWAPDGKHLAFTAYRTQVVVLDTDGGEGDLLTVARPLLLPYTNGDLECRFVATDYRGNVLTAVRHCWADARSVDEQQVVEIHGEKVGDTVFAIGPGDEATALSWSGTGHALVTLGRPPADTAVQRWDGSGDATPYDTGFPGAWGLAW